jgi:hypothetical protein
MRQSSVMDETESIATVHLTVEVKMSDAAEEVRSILSLLPQKFIVVPESEGMKKGIT